MSAPVALVCLNHCFVRPRCEHIFFFFYLRFLFASSLINRRLRSKTAALAQADSGLLIIISDLLSYSHVTTWRATLQPAAQCAPGGRSTCGSGSDVCEDGVFDDDGMAGLPDTEETLNVFLR